MTYVIDGLGELNLACDGSIQWAGTLDDKDPGVSKIEQRSLFCIWFGVGPWNPCFVYC